MNNDEVVVITGASAGVGRTTARAFGKRGARVALIARGRDGLEAAKREIEEDDGVALVTPLDVSDPNRPDNLWSPLPGDHGAHGAFDDRAIDRSIELELNKRRPWLLAGAAAILAACVAAGAPARR